jgi:hypothetical protein
VIDDLQNQYLNGYNNYPDIVTAAYHPLAHNVVNPQSTARIINDSEGVAFATVDVDIASAKRNLKVKCYAIKGGTSPIIVPRTKETQKGARKPK